MATIQTYGWNPRTVAAVRPATTELYTGVLTGNGDTVGIDGLRTEVRFVIDISDGDTLKIPGVKMAFFCPDDPDATGGYIQCAVTARDTVRFDTSGANNQGFLCVFRSL